MGLCPKGSASCGVLDMAGTFSEWVSSVYSRYPQHSHQVQNDVRSGDLDIAIRGGSFRKQEWRTNGQLRKSYLPVRLPTVLFGMPNLSPSR
jgi:formylglycine-generating enzyme required for sulfatase activity